MASGLATPSFANAGLTAATTYYFKVKAVDSAGSSSASNQASATTQSSSGGFECHVDYKNVNQWNTGFQAAISIRNTGTVPIANWTLKWLFSGNQRITNLWNGNYVQSGQSVTVNNLSYNGSISTGGSYDGLGFTANFTGTNLVPTSFSVNGVTCK